MFSAWNSKAAATWSQTASETWTRAAGLNETGFYHYALTDEKAPSDTFCRLAIEIHADSLEGRVARAWQMLRLLHPLLDCKFHQDDFAGLSLQYCWRERHERSDHSIFWKDEPTPWDEIRDDITNCPRIISDEHLSQLCIYTDTRITASEDKHETNEIKSRHGTRKLEIVLICSHAISDGIRIVHTMNDFATLLGGDLPARFKNTRDTDKLHFVLSRLPRAMEIQLPVRKRTPQELWHGAIAYILHGIRERKDMGAPHPTFSRAYSSSTQTSSSPPTTTTRQRILEFTRHETHALLTNCRRNRCTLGHLRREHGGIRTSRAAATRLDGLYWHTDRCTIPVSCFEAARRR